MRPRPRNLRISPMRQPDLGSGMVRAQLNKWRIEVTAQSSDSPSRVPCWIARDCSERNLGILAGKGFRELRSEMPKLQTPEGRAIGPA